MPRREQLEALLAEDPQDVFLNYALAMQLIGVGDSSGGMARLERVMELDPNYVPAYFQCAQAQALLGNTSRSLELLRKGIDRARAAGDQHAVEEMGSLLAQLSG
jgi:thioredoxin-like negative regulator of GroEL